MNVQNNSQRFDLRVATIPSLSSPSKQSQTPTKAGTVPLGRNVSSPVDYGFAVNINNVFKLVRAGFTDLNYGNQSIHNLSAINGNDGKGKNITSPRSNFEDSYAELIVDSELKENHAVLSGILSEILQQNQANTDLRESIKIQGDYKIHIFDAKGANAFIEIEANNIYITPDLLRWAYASPNPETKLATVIAHEIGHKITDRKIQRLKEQNPDDVFGFLEDDNTHVEDSADNIAFGLVFKAGHDLKGTLNLFTSLNEFNQGTNEQRVVIPFLSSHPHNSSRDNHTLINYYDSYLTRNPSYTSKYRDFNPSEDVSKELAKYQHIFDAEDYKHPRISAANREFAKACVFIEKYRRDTVFNSNDLRRANSISEKDIIIKEHIEFLKSIFEGIQDLNLNPCLGKSLHRYFSSRVSAFERIIKNDEDINIDTISKDLSLFNSILEKSKLVIPKEEYDTSKFIDDLNLKIFRFSDSLRALPTDLATQVENVFLDQNPGYEYDIQTFVQTFNKLTKAGFWIRPSIFLMPNDVNIKLVEDLIDEGADTMVCKIIKGFITYGADGEKSFDNLKLAFNNSKKIRDYILNDRFFYDDLFPYRERDRLREEFPKDELIKSMQETSEVKAFKHFVRLLTFHQDLNLDDCRQIIKKLRDFDKDETKDIKNLVRKIFWTQIRQPESQIIDFMIENLDILVPIDDNSGFIPASDLHYTAFSDQLKAFLMEDEGNKEKLLNSMNDLKSQFEPMDPMMPPFRLIFLETVSDAILNHDLEVRELGRYDLKLSPDNELILKVSKDDYYPEELQDKTLLDFGLNLVNNEIPSLRAWLESETKFKKLLAFIPPTLELPLLSVYCQESGIKLNDLESMKKFIKHLSKNYQLDFNEEGKTKEISEAIGFKLENKRDVTNFIRSRMYNLNKITNQEVPYALFFDESQKNEFVKFPLSQINTWFQEQCLEKGAYRDHILFELVNLNTFKDANLETQKEFIDLFDSKLKVAKYVEVFLESLVNKTELSLNEKIESINFVHKDANKEKDSWIERAFFNSSFSLEDLDKYKDFMSYNSFDNFRKESVFSNGLIALLEYEYEKVLDKKVNLLLWIMQKSENDEFIPEHIKKQLEKQNLSPNELRVFFEKLKELRTVSINNFFIGENGIFDEHIKRKAGEPSAMEYLLEEMFKDVLSLEETGAETELNRNKLKMIVKEILPKVFDSEINVKKLDIMNRLVEDLVTKKSKIEVEDLIQLLLSAYGTVGVKIAQILSSQNEIQERFPKLNEVLSTLKDDNNSISLKDFSDAIATIPEFKNRDVRIKRQLAAASVKSVFLAEIDGKEMVIKVRRKASDKLLEREIEDLRYLVDSLKAPLKEHFGIENLPNYPERIFADIHEECDLKVELANLILLGLLCEKFNSEGNDSSFKYTTPTPDPTLSNSCVMTERVLPGQNLNKIKQEGKDSLDGVEESLARFMAYSLLHAIHVDPHDGNIFKDGSKLLGFIDAGLMQKMPQLPENINRLLKDSSFLDTLSSLNIKDFELLKNLSKIIDLDVLVSGNPDDGPIKNILKLAYGDWAKCQELINLFMKDKVNSAKSLLKLRQLYLPLKKYGFADDVKEIFRNIGSKTLNKIATDIDGKSFKEAILIVLNSLELSTNFDVSKTLWRTFLTASKRPEAFQQIAKEPEIIQKYLTPSP